jgi:hypothetical protein
LPTSTLHRLTKKLLDEGILYREIEKEGDGQEFYALDDPFFCLYLRNYKIL